MNTRFVILGLMLASATLTTVPATIDVSPVFIWNASASVPIGLYRVLPEDHLAVADLVAVTPPEPIAKFLADRNYLPRGVPLLKHVLGLPGQTVCRIHLDILRAAPPGGPISTVPGVTPGGEILLRLASWPKVQRVLEAIDIIEALGIDPKDAAPDHWRHVHNRISVGEKPRAYGRARHRAWLLRCKVEA